MLPAEVVHELRIIREMHAKVLERRDHLYVSELARSLLESEIPRLLALAEAAVSAAGFAPQAADSDPTA